MLERCKSAVLKLLFLDLYLMEKDWAHEWMFRAHTRFAVPPLRWLSLALEGRALEAWCERYLEHRPQRTAAI
jgi:hypothetical protein